MAFKVGGTTVIDDARHLTSAGIDDNANTTVMTINSSEKVAFHGASVPDIFGASAGAVTISTGDSGATLPAWEAADELIIESAEGGGLTFFAPNWSSSQIYFGDPDNAGAGTIRYFHNTDSMQFSVGGAGPYLNLITTGQIVTGYNITGIPVGGSAGAVTISTGDSGATSASTSADDLIIESATDAGITIFSATNSGGYIFFGDSDGNARGSIFYTHNNDELGFRTAATTRLNITSAGQIVTGSTTTGVPVGASAGSMTISTGDSGVTSVGTGADDLIVESGGNVGISILTPNTAIGKLVFGDPEDTNVGTVEYSHVLNGMYFNSGGTTRLNITSTGQIVTGSSTTNKALGAQAGSLTIGVGGGIANTSFAPHTWADDLVIYTEGDRAGMTMVGSLQSAIYFADEDDNVRFNQTWNNATEEFIVTHQKGRVYSIPTGRQILTGNVKPDLMGTTSGSMTISTGDSGVTAASISADDLIVEGNSNGDVGLTIASGATRPGNIYFADPGGTSQGRITYDHSTDQLSLWANNAQKLTANGTGVQIGTSGARVTTILDEDTMSSDSATALATQQSIKAYVDSSAPALKFIETQDLSAAANADFTGFDATKYDAYIWILQRVFPATDGARLIMRTSTDGGVSYDSGASNYEYKIIETTTTSTVVASTTATEMRLNSTNLVGTTTGSNEYGVTGHVWMHDVNLARPTSMTFVIDFRNTSTNQLYCTGMGLRVSAADVDAVRFLFDNGNISSGTITMYGLKNA